jgi:hypothetical protein
VPRDEGIGDVRLGFGSAAASPGDTDDGFCGRLLGSEGSNGEPFLDSGDVAGTGTGR